MDLELRFSAAEIDETVTRIAGELARDYAGRNPLLVGILKGSFVFLADLVRRIGIPCEVDFVRARSYGMAAHTSGKVQISDTAGGRAAGRQVVVIEDILDTGLTLRAVVEHLLTCGASSVRTCALLVREGSPPPDYTGLWTPPGFVVGYGIDYAESYRWLPEVYVVKGLAQRPPGEPEDEPQRASDREGERRL